MPGITTKDVMALRDETGAGIMACREALLDANGDASTARRLLAERGAAQVAKRTTRTASEGFVADYNHQGRVVGVVELRCETDFVARNDGFRELAQRLAEQVAAMAPADVDELLAQAWIRDGSLTMGELVGQASARFGEKVEVGDIARIAVGG